MGRQSAPEAWTYRLADTWQDAPWSLQAGHYGTVGDIASWSDGRTAVLDTAHAAVHVVDPAGTATAVWPLGAPFGPDEPCEAKRLDAAPDGNVYVLGTCPIEGDLPLGAPTTRSHLLALSPQGVTVRSLSLGSTYSDVAVDPAGRVLLAWLGPVTRQAGQPGGTHQEPGGIDRLDTAGAVDLRIVDAALYYPVSLDVAPDGTIYVANRVPSPWNYDDPAPRPTPLPAALGLAQQSTSVEGVVVLSANYDYRTTYPFTTPEDVGVGLGRAFVSRNVEVFAVGSPEPLWTGPSGQLVVGSTDGVILHLGASARNLRVGMNHCYFQGVLDFGNSLANPKPRLLGELDRPDLAGPVNPVRLDAGSGGVALLQDRFDRLGQPPDERYLSRPGAAQPQTVQDWSLEGLLGRQRGVCAGGQSGWLPDQSSALWVNDLAMDGDAVYTVDADLLQRRPGAGFPEWTDWPGSLAPIAAASRLTAVTADAGLVAALDVGTGRVVMDNQDGTPAGWFAYGPGGPAGLATDIAMRHGVIWVALGAERSLVAYDREGTFLGRVTTRQDAWRIDVAPDGSVVALGRGGLAARYSSHGELLASWLMPDPAATAMDVSVDDQGRVYVPWIVRQTADGEPDMGPELDLHRAGVWVFRAVAREAGVAPEEAGCLVTPDKEAVPNAVPLGQPVTVTLEVAGRCPGVSDPADVVVLLDTSRSMRWDGVLERAQQLVLAFLDGLDPRAVHVALASFDTEAALQMPLTDDIGAVAARAMALDAWGDTRLAPGLEAAQAELEGERARPSAGRLVFLVTDGEHTDVARATAEAMRADGIRIVAVALPHGGLSSYLDALVAVTGDRSSVLVDPDPRSLAVLGRQIVGYRDEPQLVSQMSVADLLPANMAYVPGSASPEARVDGPRLLWQLSGPLSSPIKLTFRVLPLAVGVWPTNAGATAAYTDVRHQAGTLVFPVPEVLVWDKSTLSHRVFLPYAARGACFRLGQKADVVLAIDASESMSGPAETGGTKLGAARDAAQGFVDLLKLPRDQAAVVMFNSQASALCPLTGDRSVVSGALAALSSAPGSRLDLALETADAVLAASRGDALPVVVLASDGLQTGDDAALVQRADSLRQRGVLVFTVGLGADAADGLLSRVATRPDYYLRSPSTADLAAIYGRIVEAMACAGLH